MLGLHSPNSNRVMQKAFATPPLMSTSSPLLSKGSPKPLNQHMEYSSPMVSGKKQRGIIVERSRGFTSWIRFGNPAWAGCWRVWRLAVGVSTMFCGGFGSKETLLGVPGSEYKRSSKRKKARGGSVDSTGRRRCGERKEFLDSCLVGRWGETEMTDADLRDMEKWGKHHWKLQGEMRIARIGGCCCLFVFESKAEANNVLQRGFRRFKESVIHLKRWDPSVGCSQSREKVKEVWVRVMGLPLHLWNREVFKKIGDSCGGFIAMDESTGALKELQWARILVKVEGMGGPSSLQVVIGTSCYAIQLWWEMLPRMTDVIPAGMYGKGKKMEVREEEGGKTRASGAVEMVQAKGQLVKLTVPSEMEKAAAYQPWAREACREETDGWTDGVLVGASQGSTFPDCNFKEITDEALKEERQARGSDVGGLDMDPLRMIMTDGREAEVLGRRGWYLGLMERRQRKWWMGYYGREKRRGRAVLAVQLLG
ncbi:hypothetical protein CK203_030079 [Vitis vinifera]|uniref:DUF4283 domain-containing protein n=1 Tax=Vitis vinifera TaxID=29760 RepID=A0A438IKG5_VITVI|nr:hypothetical protein CK203_030079 [Vitis vinifera]